jgi:alcohol dehydrogenase class IV
MRLSSSVEPAHGAEVATSGPSAAHDGEQVFGSSPLTFIGPGTLDVLTDAAAAVCGRRPAAIRATVVVGSNFRSRPWADRVVAATRPMRTRFHAHSGETTPASVAELANALPSPDVVIAVGGGAVMDVAKAAAALASRYKVDERLVVSGCLGRHPPLRSPVPVVAVPTTPGTGAEATPFATVWDRRRDRKLSLASSDALPKAAVLDPTLLDGLGTAALAGAVLDACCQGAEAAWSIRATHGSAAHGLTAVALIGQLIDRVANATISAADRLTLLLAGHHSGRAIALSQTSSCHAISYALTLRLGLAHGHACGVSFARMLRYNARVTAADCADPRGPDHVRQVIGRIAAALGAAGPDAAAARIERFLAECGLPTYDMLPVPAGEVAAAALSYPRCHDNPRTLDLHRLSQLLAMPGETEESCL